MHQHDESAWVCALRSLKRGHVRWEQVHPNVQRALHAEGYWLGFALKEQNGG